MNSVILIGNLTRDPEVRYRGETAVCRMTVAVNDRKKNQQTGEWEDNPSFIPVVVFGRQAENCEKFLSKGRKVAVQGKIQTGSYVKQDGTKVYTTDVIANNVEFLNSNESQQTFQQPQQTFQQPQQQEYVTRQQYQQEKQQQIPQDIQQGFAAIPDDGFIPF